MLEQFQQEMLRALSRISCVLVVRSLTEDVEIFLSLLSNFSLTFLKCWFLHLIFVVFQSTQNSNNTCICSDLGIFCYIEKLLIELLWLSWNDGNRLNVFLLVQSKRKNQVELGEKDGKKGIFSDLFFCYYSLLLTGKRMRRAWQKCFGFHWWRQVPKRIFKKDPAKLGYSSL